MQVDREGACRRGESNLIAWTDFGIEVKPRACIASVIYHFGEVRARKFLLKPLRLRHDRFDSMA